MFQQFRAYFLLGVNVMRFKIFSVLTTTLAVLSTTALSALAQTATIQASPGSRVNVRQTPSTSAAIRYSASVGDRVNIIERTNAPDGALWYLVEFPNLGVRGWVRSDLVRIGGESSNGGSAERISFAPNTSGATVGGRVQGSASRSYLLTARAGQTLGISTITTSPFVQVRVFAPNGSNLYTGSANWSGALPSSGDYRLEVRIVPEEQQSGASGEYSLTVTVR